ncbi:hypothetical protein Y032_1336g3833 [Ancylostoma ceylanicum]|uniref:Uncharacterized protein n=1 Tax=Ancylostoma ceylanicum TaxID=53326 RepID=A0A016W5C6_9BILA|nr:hypothetical protein Y032_1336g3833 [Ancylostoma ceylanicum]
MDERQLILIKFRGAVLIFFRKHAPSASCTVICIEAELRGKVSTVDELMYFHCHSVFPLMTKDEKSAGEKDFVTGSR